MLALATGCQTAPPSAGSAPPPSVTVARPIERDFRDVSEFTGWTEAVETVEVRARVSGFIEKVRFAEGRDVKAGDVLFEIDARPYQAEHDAAAGQLAVAQAQLQKAMVEFNRISDLMKTQDAMPIEYERVKADKAVAESSVAAAQARLDKEKLNLEWTQVTAPITGRVSRAVITPGNLIAGGSSLATLLTTIVTVDPVYAYFDVDEQTTLNIQQAMREGRFKGVRDGGYVPLALGLLTEKGFPHAGHVDFVENRIDTSTGTLRVRGVFANAQKVLSPGLFARVELTLGPPLHGLLVTERAISADQDRKYVYVVDAANKVEYRPIDPGIFTDGMRVIQSGLKPGERIIISGLQRVRPGMVVAPNEVPMPVPQETGKGAAGSDAASSMPAASQPAGK